MKMEFGSMLYRSRTEMLRAIAESWMTADGINPPDTVTEFYRIHSDNWLAEECMTGWQLAVGEDANEYQEAVPSHMERYGYDLDDLTAAFAQYRAMTVEG
jgi:hypothetical protein